MSERNFYLLPPLSTLPVEDPHQWIGRIVKSYSDPDENFTPDIVPAELRLDVRDDPGFCHVEEIIESQKSRSLGASLADVLRFNASHAEADAPQFYSSKVRRLKLRQEDRNRKIILALNEVKAQLKGWHTMKHPVYLIVGVLVADRVRYAENSSTERNRQLEAKTPSQLASLAAGSPAPSPDVVKVNLADSAAYRCGTKLTAVGTRIFAIEYRVLTKRLLSTSGKIDVRPGGIRGERTFSDSNKSTTDLDAESQQSEIVADPDPLPDVIEATEEWCFDIDDD